MKKHHRLVSLASALLLALAALPCTAMAAEAGDTEPAQGAPPPAALYPAEVRTSEENGMIRLEKVYYLSTRDDPAAIPTGDFDREGRHYTLLDVLKNDLSETDSKDYIEVVTMDSGTKDMAEIIKMLEPEREIATEDGYTGILKPDYTKITVEAAGYKNNSWTVSAKRTYPNLSDADASLIPKTITDSGRTLTLAGVDWQEAGEFYNAIASYTGTASGRSVTGYTVSVEYSGEVTKTSQDTLLAVCLMLTALSMPASALEYTFDNPPTGDFGTPTSTEDIIQTGAEPANKDRSKSSALIPPGFGTPTSYLPNSGEYLTPNLAADGPLSGKYTLTVTGGTGGGAPALPGAVDTSTPTNPAYPTTSGPVTAFTDVTADLYYSNGSLGTLEIPSIGLSVKIMQGTDSAALKKGAGHFTNTSIWNGNVALAGHNRGVNNHFGKIHTLDTGNTITLTTALGTRTYTVTSVAKVDVMDNTMLEATSDNCITLFTCVMNESEYRWCVRGVEI